MPDLGRREFMELSGSSVVGSALLRQRRSRLIPADRGRFPFGTHIYREPHRPLDELRRDLPLLKRLGFTMIKIQECWNIDEQREGEIDLTNVRTLVADARQLGLGVYFGVTMELAPAWLWRKFPDAAMVLHTGQRYLNPTQYVLPGDGKPGPCWHHPGARAAAIQFLEYLGHEIGQYDNVWVWNVWQEIGFGFVPAESVCFCPYTLPAYRKWLQGRYGALPALNQVWKSGYGDWDEITPPRQYAPLPPWVDWRYFMDDVYFAAALRWKGTALRRSDPGRRPILAHVAGVTLGGSNDRRYAEALDIFGVSCYPAWPGWSRWEANAPALGAPVSRVQGLNHELWENVILRGDYMRSASRKGEWWTAELQGGPVHESAAYPMGRTPDPADIRRWVLGNLATGSRGICFWNHRPEIFWGEADGFGLLNHEGQPTPRARQAGDLGRALSRHAALFTQGVHPRSGMAIVVNESARHFLQASGRDRHMAFTIQGIHKALWDVGGATDFLDVGDLPARATDYPLLYLPFCQALAPEVIGWLRAYVAHGGVLVAEALPGRYTSYGLGAFPGGMPEELTELFGCRQQGLIQIREPNNGARWTENARSYGDAAAFAYLAGLHAWQGHQLFPAFYLQSFTPAGATPIFQYGRHTVGCEHAYGRGRALLLGTLLGHGYLGYDDPHNRDFILAVLARQGVFPDLPGGLQRRRRIRGRQEAWFLYNSTEAALQVSLPASGYTGARDLLGEPLARAGDSLHLSVASLDMRCIVLQRPAPSSAK